MTDSAGSQRLGSRAIKIPLHSGGIDKYNTPNRRRRSGRYLPHDLERADSSDAGPSSVGSDQDSWSYTPVSAARSILDRKYGQTNPIPSPANKDSLLQSSHGLLAGSSLSPLILSDPEIQPMSNTQRKDKQKAATSPPNALPALSVSSTSPLGPSMLSSSSYKSINLNSHHDDPDEPPRLITYTKHSQGFTWNDELFLPSYMLGRYGRGGWRKKEYDADFGDEEHCPVADIFVTDEEAEAMMP